MVPPALTDTKGVTLVQKVIKLLSHEQFCVFKVELLQSFSNYLTPLTRSVVPSSPNPRWSWINRGLVIEILDEKTIRRSSIETAKRLKVGSPRNFPGRKYPHVPPTTERQGHTHSHSSCPLQSHTYITPVISEYITIYFSTRVYSKFTL